MIDQHTLTRLGGIASTHQLRAAGGSSEQLTAAVRAGELRRIRTGIYALPTVPADAIAAVVARGRLSCVTAARTYGLWGGDDSRLHLQFARNSRAGPRAGPRDRLVRHWLPTQPHEEVWRVSVADCLRSVARCADEEIAVAVFDTAISAGLTNPLALRDILAGQPANVRARGLLARPGSDSGVESIVRQRLQRSGHFVEQQVHVEGVGRVDLRIDGVLYLEIDGFGFHSDRQAFDRDRLRDAGLGSRGMARMRVSATQVRTSWPAVLRAVQGVLAHAAAPAHSANLAHSAKLAHSANSQERRDQAGVLACSTY